MEEITIRTDLQPGDLGRIVSLHGVAYKDEDHGHFGGLVFEAFLARMVAEFILDKKGAGRVWLAEKGKELIGCAAMMERGTGGQLRWVVLLPEARGAGLG